MSLSVLFTQVYRLNFVPVRLRTLVRSTASLSALIALALATSGFRLASGAFVPFGAAAAVESLGALPLVVPTIRYGLELERFGEVIETEVGMRMRLVTSLREAGLSRARSRRLARAAIAERAGVRLLEPHTRAVVRGRDGEPAHVFIALDDLERLHVDLRAETIAFEDADGITREFETMALFYTGKVDSMLAETALEPALDAVVRRALTEEMPLAADFRIGLIKLIYTAKRDELGVARGYGAVEALRYGIGDNERTAYRFSDDALDVEGFFRPDGSSATRTWLRQPVAEGVMSSPFNLRRRHPVLRRIKPHYGTDYAADYGEPILALSDGVVVAKARTGGNGNFVKIEHDGTYATQYLHMKGFAEGLRPGQQVRKGDVIGYVGSTGLSSGPHVCLRFWKHGRQVDFERELSHLPTTSQLDVESMAAFEKRQSTLVQLLEPQA